MKHNKIKWFEMLLKKLLYEIDLLLTSIFDDDNRSCTISILFLSTAIFNGVIWFKNFKGIV